MVAQGNWCRDTITINFTPREINTNRVLQPTRNPHSSTVLSVPQHIVGQKVNGSHIFISLREYWYYLVLSSDIHIEGGKIMRENNPVRLPFDSWYSLCVPQCAAAWREN